MSEYKKMPYWHFEWIIIKKRGVNKQESVITMPYVSFSNILYTILNDL